MIRLLVLVLIFAGCGVKGPPLPPVSYRPDVDTLPGSRLDPDPTATPSARPESEIQR